jgi:hypothetical protein
VWRLYAAAYDQATLPPGRGSSQQHLQADCTPLTMQIDLLAPFGAPPGVQ